jgi:hypothetical protein
MTSPNASARPDIELKVENNAVGVAIPEVTGKAAVSTFTGEPDI